MPKSKLIYGMLANLICFAGPLFLPAGTLDWWRGWVIVALGFGGSALAVVGLARLNTGILEERMKSPVQKGQPAADKVAVIALLVAFFGQMVFTSLDVFRLRWMARPGAVVSSAGLILFVAGWWVAYQSMRQNAFAAPAVKYQESRNHAVVDTGVYAVVRHPMYAGMALMTIGMPLWLESYAGAVFAVLPIGAVAARILVEERFLQSQLSGYADYTQRVRYRLAPGLW
jgi:protein-S-isoprenylcysteine O-methyltransferase Ste14